MESSDLRNDEFFYDIKYGRVWTRKELREHFPPGNPPDFKLRHYTFDSNREIGMYWMSDYGTFDYEAEFGWSNP